MSDSAKQQELEDLMEKIDQREKAASRRMIFYSLIPIFIGLMWLVFTLNRVQKARTEVNQLEERRTILIDSIEFWENRSDELKALAMKTEWEVQQSQNPYLSNLKIKGQEKDAIYCVVAYLDWSLEDARVIQRKLARQLEQSKKGEGKMVKIFKKNGYYRTIVGPYNTLAATRSILQPIQKNLYEEAYVAKWNNWCKNREVKNGYIDCD